jgi:hypothetical protein
MGDLALLNSEQETHPVSTDQFEANSSFIMNLRNATLANSMVSKPWHSLSFVCRSEFIYKALPDVRVLSIKFCWMLVSYL